MTSQRQLIDWHTHTWKPEHMTAQARSDMKVHGVIGGEATPEDHKRSVVDGGAEKFVVINAPVRAYKKIPNDFIADYVAQYPGQAVGFASVDPNDPTAAEEFERSVTDLGLQGLKVSPVYQGFDPWSPEAWELYYLANKYDVSRDVPHGRHVRSQRDPGMGPCLKAGQGRESVPGPAHYRGPLWAAEYAGNCDVDAEEHERFSRTCRRGSTGSGSCTTDCWWQSNTRSPTESSSAPTFP